MNTLLIKKTIHSQNGILKRNFQLFAQKRTHAYTPLLFVLYFGFSLLLSPFSLWWSAHSPWQNDRTLCTLWKLCDRINHFNVLLALAVRFLKLFIFHNENFGVNLSLHLLDLFKWNYFIFYFQLMWLLFFNW